MDVANLTIYAVGILFTIILLSIVLTLMFQKCCCPSYEENGKLFCDEHGEYSSDDEQIPLDGSIDLDTESESEKQ